MGHELDTIINKIKMKPEILVRKKERCSNAELLRIVAMFMIVLGHFSAHGFFDEELRFNWIDNELNKYFLRVILMGDLGVDIFVLISGYYMIENQTMRVSKGFRLIAQVLFYSVGIIFVLLLIGKPVGVDMVFYSLTPISSSLYWFVTCYVILYLIHPFLNLIPNNFNGEGGKNNYLRFLVILTILFSVYHTFLNRDMYGNYLVQFVYLYYIGGYIKIYPFRIKRHTVLIPVLIWLIIPLIGYLIGNSTIINHINFFYTRMSLFAIIFAIIIFSYFILVRAPFYNKAINMTATGTLAVYLIHDNPYFRDIIYEDLYGIKKYANDTMLPVVILIEAMIVFVSGILLDFIRQYLFEKADGIKNLLPGKINHILSYEFKVNGK